MVDWPTYNETLVRRGQVLLGFDVVDRWDLELSQMNLGKVGEPYCYPDSFIELLDYMRAYFHLPYRQTQGVVMAHANKVPNTPHYSTISRRINKLEIKINEKLGYDIGIALDSTGIKLANTGEWMHHKWHVTRKGYLKMLQEVIPRSLRQQTNLKRWERSVSYGYR
jgi:hypothetical protein